MLFVVVDVVDMHTYIETVLERGEMVFSGRNIIQSSPVQVQVTGREGGEAKGERERE